jgi:hypothetical protein
MASLLVFPGTVAEITDGHLYDVASLTDGEVIGTAVPAWVARVIAATSEGLLIAQVHNPDRPLGVLLPPQRTPSGPERANPGAPRTRTSARERQQ